MHFERKRKKRPSKGSTTPTGRPSARRRIGSTGMSSTSGLDQRFSHFMVGPHRCAGSFDPFFGDHGKVRVITRTPWWISWIFHGYHCHNIKFFGFNRSDSPVIELQTQVLWFHSSSSKPVSPSSLTAIVLTRSEHQRLSYSKYIDSIRDYRSKSWTGELLATRISGTPSCASIDSWGPFWNGSVQG